MAHLSSRFDPQSEEAKRRRTEMQERVDQVEALKANVRARSERARAKFEAKGKLLPHERVAALLDPGSDYLELSALAGFKMHDDDGEGQIAGGGNLIGIGWVEGVRVVVVASNSAIKGGTISPMGLKKTLRAQEIALQHKLPMIHLVESGGANLLHQAEIFVDGGRSFANMARLSAAGIPQITVVHGSSTAGGAYLPGLSDYVVMVKDHAKVFLAGPPLVAAALGERATEAELGGAAMHASTSGLAEYVAEDDAHGVAIARQIIASWGWATSPPPANALPPRFAADELLGIVPADPSEPFDQREILARLVDDSHFLEFKASFGRNTVCGHAAICGHRVGIVANNGPIFPEGSVKAAQFIQLCCQTQTPLIFLMNTTGYMVGTQAEQAGAVKHGSKMIQAVANATVPRFTILTGGGYGAGYYGMSGRSYDPNFLFAWPSGKVAVMGGEQAAQVLKMITRAKLERMGAPVVEANLEALAGHVRDTLNDQTDALYATARLWDDGILDPRHTRQVLGFCLQTAAEAVQRTLHTNTFGVARG